MVLATNSLALLGGALTALVAGTLLLTSKYSRTWLPLCLNSYAFWGYLFCYAALGATAIRIVFATAVGRMPYIVGVPNYIFWPLAVAFIGTLAKMSIVGAMPGADQFHMTARAILLLFEPELLAHISDDEYFALRKIVRAPAQRYGDLSAVRQAITAHVPDRIEQSKKLVFLNDLEKRTTVEEAMILYVRLVGPRWFRFTFANAPTQVQTALLERDELPPIPVSSRKSPKSVHTTMAADVASRRATT